jgi:hypothetical protein
VNHLDEVHRLDGDGKRYARAAAKLAGAATHRSPHTQVSSKSTLCLCLCYASTRMDHHKRPHQILDIARLQVHIP